MHAKQSQLPDKARLRRSACSTFTNPTKKAPYAQGAWKALLSLQDTASSCQVYCFMREWQTKKVQHIPADATGPARSLEIQQMLDMLRLADPSEPLPARLVLWGLRALQALRPAPMLPHCAHRCLH